MKLKLSVVAQAGDEIDNITIEQDPISIGREVSNTLVLDDPRRYISSHHATIDFRAPDYFITDTSTNGVLINQATLPIGDGNSLKLSDGDKIRIGEYILSVSIIDDQQQQTDLPKQTFNNEILDFSEDPFAELSSDSVQEMIDENQLMPGQGDDAALLNALDFPDLEDINPGLEEEEKLSKPKIEQPVPAFKEAFQPFKPEKKEQEEVAKDIFADDWFKDSQSEGAAKEELFPEDFFAEQKQDIDSPAQIDPVEKVSEQHAKPEESVRTVMPAEPVKPDEPIPQVQPAQPVQRVQPAQPVKPIQPVQQKQPVGTEPQSNTPELQTLLVDNFLRGAGLENAGMNESLTADSFYIIGKILRASVQGTMDVLIGRAKIKNEMHLDVTTIKSIENNPVKFSVTAEEAIRKLLAPQDAGYLQAEAAIDEAFDDIRVHQISVISGMQTALLEVLKRFDPEKLEHRLQVESPLSASIPIHKQAKLWRLFEHLYTDIEHEARDNFYRLFGQAFAQSYEQQMNKLKDSKKDSPF